MKSRIAGLDRLNRKLARLPKALRAEMREAIAKGAAEIVAAQKALVPEDTHALEESISWAFGDAPAGALLSTTGRKRTLTRGLMIGTADDLRATIYAGDVNAFWARWVEFGTAPHINGGRFAGTEHPGTAPQPFFYAGYRAVKKRVKSRVRRAIRKALRQAAKNG